MTDEPNSSPEVGRLLRKQGLGSELFYEMVVSRCRDVLQRDRRQAMEHGLRSVEMIGLSAPLALVVASDRL